MEQIHPIWYIALTAILANMGKITELVKVIGEKILPTVFKAKTARERIESDHAGENVRLLAEFLDQEQQERKREREQCAQMLANLAQQNASLAQQYAMQLARTVTVLEAHHKQQSSVIQALMTVASGQRASAARTDDLEQLFRDLADEVRPLVNKRRTNGLPEQQEQGQ